MGPTPKRWLPPTSTLAPETRKPATMPRDGSRRILLVRLSAIGDLVFASPLIASARRAYPGARIAWLVQPECASLLAGHPDLDEVIAWPLGQWRRLWRARAYRQLWRELRVSLRDLRARRFDLAIDLQGLLKSALPVGLCGARERIGLGSREGGGLLMTRVIDRGPDSSRISSEYRHLAAVLGWPTDDFRMRVYPSPEAEREAAALIADHGLGSGYAVICPFTTRAQKHWLDARWVPLAARIQGRYGLPAVMLGGPADEAAARAIAPAGAPIINLVGVTSLLSAAALIRRAHLVVGVDTGLSHMGIAFERPTVLLFGSTCPYTQTGSPHARVLYHPLQCSPCRRRPTCDGRFDCMHEIEVEEVMATLAALVDPAQPRMESA
jgi:heptosyltransferase-1